VPWMIAIAKHDCQQRARAVLEKHAENSKRAPGQPKAPGTLSCYFPMTREKVKDRTGRSTTKDLYYLGHYFFVRLERDWIDDVLPAPAPDFFFLKLTPDWIDAVKHARGVANVFCSEPKIEDVDEELPLQPLIVSDAYVHNNYKCYEDQSGYIPLKRKWKRGQKFRVKAGLLEGAVGIFEDELSRGRAAALINGRHVELPDYQRNLDPIYTGSHRAFSKSGVSPGGT
jgi:hypothetical protein